MYQSGGTALKKFLEKPMREKWTSILEEDLKSMPKWGDKSEHGCMDQKTSWPWILSEKSYLYRQNIFWHLKFQPTLLENPLYWQNYLILCGFAYKCSFVLKK